ncbi:MAG: hypothetical protein WKG03_20715 [Telluria sp.]
MARAFAEQSTLDIDLDYLGFDERLGLLIGACSITWNRCPV